jgi:hypothetical protein
MTLQQIFEDISTKVSDVCAAINRGPARVHADLAGSWIARLELFKLPRVGVEKANRHCYRWSDGVVERWSSESTVATAILLLAGLEVLDQSGRERRHSFATA